MAWFRLPSGTLWWGDVRPSGAVDAEGPRDGAVDGVDELDAPGTDVPVELVADHDEPLEVVPAVEGQRVDLQLEDLTVAELRDLAGRRGIEVSPRAHKAELVAALAAAHEGQA